MINAELTDQIKADYQALSKLPSFRRLVWRYMDCHGNVHGGSYTGEAISTAFEEGRRFVGMQIRAEVMACVPGLLEQMITEDVTEAENNG